MKAFALAVVATAGLLLSASPADAQWRSRGSYGYSYPSYGYTRSYSTYSYPTYGAVVPAYSDRGVVVTSGYTPTYGAVVPTYSDREVVVTSGYTPTYSPMVYPSAYTYPSGYGSYYSSPTYGSGVYVSPAGGYVGSRRIWRW